jgi:hypothetical protein
MMIDTSGFRDILVSDKPWQIILSIWTSKLEIRFLPKRSCFLEYVFQGMNFLSNSVRVQHGNSILTPKILCASHTRLLLETCPALGVPWLFSIPYLCQDVRRCFHSFKLCGILKVLRRDMWQLAIPRYPKHPMVNHSEALRIALGSKNGGYRG